MNSPMLELHGLTFGYSGAPAASLCDLTLVVERGTRLAIVGANGAGKSTLLLHLNGTLRPQRGAVRLLGAPADYSTKGLLAWRSMVGLVFQDPDDQLFAASVEQDVSFGPLNQGCSDHEALQRASVALEAMGISSLAARAPHALSFGQKRRVAIAGVLAMQPEVMVFDEPTAGLDLRGQEQMLRVLEALALSAKTLIVTTHELDFALRFASEVAVLHGGRILSQGGTRKVLGDEELMERAGLQVPLRLSLEKCLDSFAKNSPEIDGVRLYRELSEVLHPGGTLVRQRAP